MTAIAIARVDQAGSEASLPTEHVLPEGGLQAVDPCGLDILRNPEGVRDDGILDVSAVQRQFQRPAVAIAVAPLQLVALGFFGRKVRVSEPGVVQFVKCRGAEALAVGHDHVVAGIQRYG